MRPWEVVNTLQVQKVTFLVNAIVGCLGEERGRDFSVTPKTESTRYTNLSAVGTVEAAAVVVGRVTVVREGMVAVAVAVAAADNHKASAEAALASAAVVVALVAAVVLGNNHS